MTTTLQTRRRTALPLATAFAAALALAGRLKEVVRRRGVERAAPYSVRLLAGQYIGAGGHRAAQRGCRERVSALEASASKAKFARDVCKPSETCSATAQPSDFGDGRNSQRQRRAEAVLKNLLAGLIEVGLPLPPPPSGARCHHPQHHGWPRTRVLHQVRARRPPLARVDDEDDRTGATPAGATTRR